jgi:ABC-type dipeptide/oligopeptide/nickel transport system permease subunit
MSVNALPSTLSAESRRCRLAAPHRAAAGSPLGIVGATFVLFWIVVAIFAPWLAPYDPIESDYEIGLFALPSAAHWLGTDDQARDILSRIIYGARIVLTISPLATLCGYVVGIVLGLLAGYYGGWVDTLLMQVCNVILSFPVIVLYVIIMMKFGPRS